MASRLTFNVVAAGAAQLAARLRGGEIPQPTASVARVEVKRGAPGRLAKAAGSGRIYSAIASNNELDRHGDQIEQSGWDLAAYKRNPIICWAHDYQSLPVGKATNVGVERDQLIVEFRLADTSLANQVADLIDEGILNAVSVGFLPTKWEPLPEGWGRRYIQQQLLEVSLVSVGANPSALIQVPLARRSYHADADRQPRLAARIGELRQLRRTA